MILFFGSKILTFPEEVKIFLILLYSKLFASIFVPSVEVAVPLFLPINMFPFSLISISVTSKLKLSLE